jgi:hypothetical protein
MRTPRVDQGNDNAPKVEIDQKLPAVHLLRAAGRCLTKVRFWKIEKTITWLPVYFHRKKASVKAELEKEVAKCRLFLRVRRKRKDLQEKAL